MRDIERLLSVPMTARELRNYVKNHPRLLSQFKDDT